MRRTGNSYRARRAMRDGRLKWIRCNAVGGSILISKSD
jgi:hypothetical protein